MPLSLSVLPDQYAICRLPSSAPLPDWATAPGRGIVAIVRSDDELSILCVEARVPSEAHARGGWRALVVKGPLSFETVGVIASMSAPLASEGISLLTLATFDTDYLFVQAGELSRAVETLRRAGFAVSEAP